MLIPITYGIKACSISERSMGSNGIYKHYHFKGYIKLNNASQIFMISLGLLATIIIYFSNIIAVNKLISVGTVILSNKDRYEKFPKLKNEQSLSAFSGRILQTSSPERLKASSFWIPGENVCALKIIDTAKLIKYSSLSMNYSARGSEGDNWFSSERVPEYTDSSQDDSAD